MILPLGLALALSVAAEEALVLSVEESTSTPLEEVHGEKLPASALGPGRIESLAAVRARAAEAPRSKPRRGAWVVPKRSATSRAHSGLHHVTNEWGDPRMEIGFPEPVDFEGAWIAGASGLSVWPSSVRAVGYRAGEAVGASAWSGPLDEEPAWFGFALEGVDRVELEALPAFEGAAWYALDDLTYRRGDALAVVDFEDCEYGQRLSEESPSGAGYAGLAWGFGSGFARPPAGAGDAVPGPQSTSGAPTPVDAAPASAPAGFLGGGGTAPVAVFGFAGLDRAQASNSFPPDTCGAIGPAHYCTIVNRGFAVYDRVNGAQLFVSSLVQFLPPATGDPRILFDPHSQRWFAIATDFSGSIQLAVSLSDDPLGSWFKTAFQASGGSDAGCSVDYPTLGVDAHGVYVGAFMVGGCALTLFAIDKAPLVAPAPSLGTITAFRNLSPITEAALQPALTHGAAPGEYVVSNTTNAIRVRRVNPPLTAPTITTVGAADIGPQSAPLNVPALGSTVPLKTYDVRFMNTVVHGDRIWTTHHVRLDGRAAVRWYEIDGTTGALVQSGTVSDPTLHYFYPSIGVNAQGDVVLGFSGSSASQFAGAYFTGRLSSDPPGEMAPPQVLRPGAGPYTVLDPTGFNRWGDYSLTTLDPLDGTRLWTLQEYAFTSNQWGTWVGVLEFGGTVICPPPAPYCVGAPNSAGPGARIGSLGTTSGTIQDLMLTCTGCPSNRPGTFYYGHNPIQLPFGQGFRCVGGGTYRLAPTSSDAFGDVFLPVDFSAPPAGAGPGALAVGTTWYFQFWYRDPAAGGSGFNLSDGLEIAICP